MTLEELYLLGISKTKFGRITNPVRRLLFRFLRPYFSGLINSSKNNMEAVTTDVAIRFGKIESELADSRKDRKVSAILLTAIESGLAANQKDMEAMEKDMEAMEKDMEAMAFRHITIESTFAANQRDLVATASLNASRLAAVDRTLEDHFSQLCTLRETTGHPSYSQVGEDRIASYIFERMGMSLDSIKYLDIGAAFPSGHNNTYLFYQAGAVGCLVEADPDYLHSYQTQRPRDLVVHAAVVPTRLKGAGEITFYRTTDRGWSTVSEIHLAAAFDAGKVSSGAVELKVPALTVMEVIERFGEIGNKIDLLSIDIEGMDLEILMEIDFERIRPSVVVIENKFNQATNNFSTQASEVMMDRGYVLYASTQVNSIFIGREIVDRIRY